MGSEDEDLYYSDDNLYSSEVDYEEIADCDSLDDDVRDRFTAEKYFIVLSEGDIRRRQEDDILNISSLLGLSREAASILLRSYRWSMNDAQEEWFADEERVRKAVGLLENPVVEISGSGVFYCKICLDKLPINKSRSVGCGHPFCEECLRTYIKTSINDGPDCLRLRCPEPSCGAAVGQDLVDMLVSEENKRKYSSYLVRSYVQENKKIRWCPAPGCDCAVEFVLGSENYDVTCGCSYSFCWNCSEEIHRPVDCETVSKWMLKNNSESENMNWLLVHSKPCPNCRRPIEKNQGCMHMTCQLCKHHFCWLCLGNWSEHSDKTGGYYACNVYEKQNQDGKIDDAERQRKYAEKALDRYLHYYERWASNQKAMEKAKEELKEMQDLKLDELRSRHGESRAQMDFIVQAWEQIIECRRVLKWTYAYGYYLPEEEQIKKQFFEYLQGEAEAALEKLHHCTEKEIVSVALEKLHHCTEKEIASAALEKLHHCTKKEILSFYGLVDQESCSSTSFQEFRMKLVDLTRVNRNYFENLVRAFENGLADVTGC